MKFVPGEDDGDGGGSAGLRAPQVGGVGPGHGEQPGLLLGRRLLLAVHVYVVQWQFRNTRCTFSVQLATTIAAKVILKMQFLRSLFLFGAIRTYVQNWQFQHMQFF